MESSTTYHGSDESCVVRKPFEAVVVHCQELAFEIGSTIEIAIADFDLVRGKENSHEGQKAQGETRPVSLKSASSELLVANTFPLSMLPPSTSVAW